MQFISRRTSAAAAVDARGGSRPQAVRGGTDLRRLRLDYLDDVPCASKLALAFIPVPVHTMIACAGQPTPRDAAWRAVATDLVYAKAYAWDR